MGPVPSKWRGIYQRGTEDIVRCNRSILFSTSLTAFGNGNGTTNGGSPKAHVASYKDCWPPVDDDECFDADLMVAFEAAISDGVGVLSVSLGDDYGREFFKDGVAIVVQPHFLPASHVNYTYLTRAKTEVEVKPAPFVAWFSSRWPNLVEPAILKPDITAPGVDIIAAFSEGTSPTDENFDKCRVAFNAESGTSVSCPHVSGIVGLLKTLHPDWNPAAIQSAIMTSARTRDDNKEPMLDSSMERATPFAYGSGHMRPNRAMDPGLPNKCPKSFTLADFNYPSIAVANLSSDSMIVTRRVKNVGSPSTYKASVRAPAGVSIYVKPTSLQFRRIGVEKKFEIVLKAKVAGKPEDYVFGQLKWSDGKHYVRSPIVVKN
ncbi:Subtilase [Parasponia andersonii]|uniref:Subtilase n=1 Tax=Parasponia andersonii TaxID=3476 RepID=A0A2P5BEP2_PARAD|nr:Subtilase [Parasponia andersonii]